MISVSVPEINCSKTDNFYTLSVQIGNSSLFCILAVISVNSMSHRIFYIERYVLPLPEGHKFPVLKYGLLRSRLADDPRFRFHPAPPVDRHTVELAHDPIYVKQFMNCELPA